MMTVSDKKIDLKRIKREAKYLSDPLLLFGILWCAISIFSLIQNYSNFDLGDYFSLFIEEYRVLSQWLVNVVFKPFSLSIPQLPADIITTWIVLAGTTARAQQIKFKRAVDEQIDLINQFRYDEAIADTLEERLEFLGSVEGVERRRRIKSMTCIPVNLMAWPLVFFAEIYGLNSTSQVLNIRLIYLRLFGWEGSHVSKIFSSGAKVIFILQWSYIMLALFLFFALNVLDVYFSEPNII